MKHPKKWWGIRHVRHRIQIIRFNIWWWRIGHLLGAFPNPADIEYLDAVWRGDE